MPLAAGPGVHRRALVQLQIRRKTAGNGPDAQKAQSNHGARAHAKSVGDGEVLEPFQPRW